MEFFTLTDQDVSVNLILHYNFPFRFLQSFDYQQVPAVYMVLFDLCEGCPISLENLTRVYKYAQYSGLFLEMAIAILYGESKLDAKKSDLRYKPNNLADIIITNPEATIEQDFAIIRHIENRKQQRLPELDYTVTIDIDGIADKIKRFKTLRSLTLDLPAKPKIKNLSMGGPMLSIEKMKMYPSLYEKARQLERNASEKHMFTETEVESSTRDSRRIPTTTKKLRHTTQTKSFASLELPQIQNNLTMSVSSSRREIDTSTDPMSMAKLPSPSNSNEPKMLIKPTSPDQQQKSKFTTPVLRKIVAVKPGISNTGSKMISPYLLDESLDPRSIRQLSDLYPANLDSLMESEMEKELRGDNFSPERILQKDEYPLKLCELLHIMIRKVIEKRSYTKLDLPTAPHGDTLGFWWALLDPNNGQFFELMMKVNLIREPT